MKFLVVFALLICFAAAGDWSDAMTCNASQTNYYYRSDSTGYCTFSIKYTESDTTFVISDFTCVGTGNITAIHFHNCSSTGTNLQDDTGNPLPDGTWTLPADPTKFPYADITVKITTQDQIDQFKMGRVYINIHTNYPYYGTNGEVRCNLNNMIVKFNIGDTYVADGSVQTYGPVPDSGVQSYCFSSDIYTSDGKGGLSLTTCWCYEYSSFYFTVVAWGLDSNLDTLEWYWNDQTYYFIYIYSSEGYLDCPSLFVYTTSTGYLLDFVVAYMASGDAVLKISTDLTTNALSLSIAPSGTFPESKATCRPAPQKDYVNPTDPTDTTLKCYFGTEKYSTSYDCTYTGGLCIVEYAIDSNILSCSDPQYCYSCDCTADFSTIPSVGYVCCDTNLCNPSFSIVACITGSGSGMISSGILVSLMIALIMKWLN